jgi:hypothetical protein
LRSANVFVLLVVPGEDHARRINPHCFDPGRPRFQPDNARQSLTGELKLVPASTQYRSVPGGVQQVKLTIHPKRRAVRIHFSRHGNRRSIADLDPLGRAGERKAKEMNYKSIHLKNIGAEESASTVMLLKGTMLSTSMLQQLL